MGSVARRVVAAAATAVRRGASPDFPDIPAPVEIAMHRPTESRARHRAKPAHILATGFLMKYAIEFVEVEHHILQRKPVNLPAYWAAWGAFAKSMAESGLMCHVNHNNSRVRAAHADR